MVSWAVLVGGLTVIVGIGVVFTPKVGTVGSVSSAEPGAQPSAPALDSPKASGSPPADAFSPLGRIGVAKSRAAAWMSDAVLVSIDARPVVSGKVDASQGGKIMYAYGKPTGQGFGPGARVQPSGFQVEVTKDATRSSKVPLRRLREASEPNCSIREAVRELRATGVPADAELEMIYSFSDKYDRAVWQATVVGKQAAPHFVDGWSCSILVR
jgi:hypothetical protein